MSGICVYTHIYIYKGYSENGKQVLADVDRGTFGFNFQPRNFSFFFLILGLTRLATRESKLALIFVYNHLSGFNSTKASNVCTGSQIANPYLQIERSRPISDILFEISFLFSANSRQAEFSSSICHGKGKRYGISSRSIDRSMSSLKRRGPLESCSPATSKGSQSVSLFSLSRERASSFLARLNFDTSSK